MIWRMNCLRDSQDILWICVSIINLLQSFPVLFVCPFHLDCAILLISWCEICELSLAPGTFIVYSYKYQHDDGRVSYPLCFIFSSPVGKKQLLWMYSACCWLRCLIVKVVNVGICICCVWQVADRSRWWCTREAKTSWCTPFSWARWASGF